MIVFYNEQYMEVYLVSQISGNGTSLGPTGQFEMYTQGIDWNREMTHEITLMHTTHKTHTQINTLLSVCQMTTNCKEAGICRPIAASSPVFG